MLISKSNSPDSIVARLRSWAGLWRTFALGLLQIWFSFRLLVMLPNKPDGSPARSGLAGPRLKAKNAFWSLFGSFRLALLQNLPDAFISAKSRSNRGGLCMITFYSQIAFSRPKPMPDACVAL
jgi:hypothetical protein